MKGVYTLLIDVAAVACPEWTRTGLSRQTSRKENARAENAGFGGHKTTARGQRGVIIYEH